MANLAKTYRDTVAASWRVARQAAFVTTIGAASLLCVAGISSVMQPGYSTSLSAVATDPQVLRKSLRPTMSTPSQAAPTSVESSGIGSSWAPPRPSTTAEETPETVAIQRPTDVQTPGKRAPETIDGIAQFYERTGDTMGRAARFMGMLMIFIVLVIGVVRRNIGAVLIAIGIAIAIAATTPTAVSILLALIAACTLGSFLHSDWRDP